MTELPNIALMMIVKNEAKTLPRLLQSVRSIISSWRIIDTGSTDGTQDLIFSTLGHLPGELLEEPWTNFGVNRSSLVSKFPEDADFGLLLDADQIVNVDSPASLAADLAAAPEVDTFMIDVRDQKLTYQMPYLVRVGKDYFYVGATHEYLAARQPLKRGNLASLWISHVGDGGSKRNKFERDIALLTEGIAAGDDTPRSRFYLGQSYESLNRRAEAIEQYQIVTKRSKWDEEKYLAHLRMGRMAVLEKRNEDATGAFMAAIATCPDRHEARYELAKLYSAAKHHAAALAILRDRAAFHPQQRILFLEPWLPLWAYDNEIGVHLWHIGQVSDAKQIFEEILSRPGIPAEGEELVKKNLSFC